VDVQRIATAGLGRLRNEIDFPWGPAQPLEPPGRHGRELVDVPRSPGRLDALASRCHHLGVQRGPRVRFTACTMGYRHLAGRSGGEVVPPPTALRHVSRRDDGGPSGRRRDVDLPLPAARIRPCVGSRGRRRWCGRSHLDVAGLVTGLSAPLVVCSPPISSILPFPFSISRTLLSDVSAPFSRRRRSLAHSGATRPPSARRYNPSLWSGIPSCARPSRPSPMPSSRSRHVHVEHLLDLSPLPSVLPPLARRLRVTAASSRARSRTRREALRTLLCRRRPSFGTTLRRQQVRAGRDSGGRLEGIRRARRG